MNTFLQKKMAPLAELLSHNQDKWSKPLVQNANLLLRQFLKFNFVLSPIYIKHISFESAVLNFSNRLNNEALLGQLSLASELLAECFFQQHFYNSHYKLKLVKINNQTLQKAYKDLQLKIHITTQDLDQILFSVRSKSKHIETFSINIYDSKNQLCYLCDLDYEISLYTNTKLLEDR